MLAPTLLLAAQLLLTQASSPATHAPPEPPARSRLSLLEAEPRSRPSPAWVLLRAPLSLGAGAVAGVVTYFTTFFMTTALSWPFGCFTLFGRSPPEWCNVVTHSAGFLMAGVASGATVAGVGMLLQGEGDIRHPAIAGLLAGTGFAIAYALQPGSKHLTELTLKGEGMRVQRMAFVVGPALAVLAYEVGALLRPSSSLKLAPAVTPIEGGALFAVGGRF